MGWLVLNPYNSKSYKVELQPDLKDLPFPDLSLAHLFPLLLHSKFSPALVSEEESKARGGWHFPLGDNGET